MFLQEINRRGIFSNFHWGTETDLLPTSVAPVHTGSGTLAFANCLPTIGNFCQLFANFYKLFATSVVLTYLHWEWSGVFGNCCIFFYPLIKSGANVQFFKFFQICTNLLVVFRIGVYIVSESVMGLWWFRWIVISFFRWIGFVLLYQFFFIFLPNCANVLSN